MRPPTLAKDEGRMKNEEKFQDGSPRTRGTRPSEIIRVICGQDRELLLVFKRDAETRSEGDRRWHTAATGREARGVGIRLESGFGTRRSKMRYVALNEYDAENIGERESRWVKVGQGEFLPEHIF